MLRKQLQEALQGLPLSAQNQIRNVVPDSVQIDKRNDPPEHLPAFDNLRLLEKEFLGFELDMLRPEPEPITVLQDD